MRTPVLAALFAILVCSAPASAEDTAKAFLRGPANSAQVVVTVQGSAGQQVVVELHQSRRTLATARSAITAGSRSVVLALPLTEGSYEKAAEKGAQLHLLVKRASKGKTDVAAVPVAGPQQSPKNEYALSALTFLFAMVSVGAGAFLNDFITHRRARALSGLESRRADHERDLEHLRAFLSDWQGGTDEAYLVSTFTDLAANASLPPGIRDLYRRTRRILADAAVPREEKEVAAERLLTAVQELTRAPSL